MTTIDEQDLKAEIASVMSDHGINKGHLVIYLDGDRFRFVGDLSVAFLTPLLIKTIAEKLMK